MPPSQQLTFLAPPSPRPLQVREMPTADQPQTRLLRNGSAVLSQSELLAVILDGQDGPSVAHALLSQFGSLHGIARASAAQLTQVAGVTAKRVARLLALVEGAARLQQPEEERPRITCPSDAADLVMPRMRYMVQEELWVLLLNVRNEVIHEEHLYRGTIDTSPVRVAEVFRPAIERKARRIIVVHNHPSGDPSPSREDVGLTRELVKAGNLLNIELTDHLVIGAGRFVSLKERGLGFDG
jgi:DNA repair protein RadC